MAWNLGSSYWIMIGNGGSWHPNGVETPNSRTRTLLYAVIKWQSVVAGPVHVVAHFSKQNLGGNGVRVHFYKNDALQTSLTLPYNGSGNIDQHLQLSGSDYLAFVLDPLDGDDYRDGSTYNISIYTGTPDLTNLAIIGPVTIAQNCTTDYTCTAQYSDGSTADVTAAATWSIVALTPPMVDFSIAGGELAVGELYTEATNITIQASYGGLTSTKVVTVTNPVPCMLECSVTEATSESLTLTWHSLSGSGCSTVSTYEAQYREHGLTAWDGISTTGTNYVINQLKHGALYDLRVRAVAPAGSGPWRDLPAMTEPSMQDFSKCVVQTVPTAQNGLPLSDTWIDFVGKFLIKKGIGAALPDVLTSLPEGMSIDPFTILFGVMANVISQIGNEDYPDLWIQGVIPNSNRSENGLPVVTRGQDIIVVVIVDTRGKTKAIDGAVELASSYWALPLYQPDLTSVELMSASEAANLPLGQVYMITPKTALSTSVPNWVALYRRLIEVRVGFPGKYSRQDFTLVEQAGAPSASADGAATLQATSLVASPDSLSVAIMPTNSLPAMPGTMHPLLGLEMLPEGLQFTNPAVLTVHRQPGWEGFSTNAVIMQWADGEWNEIPTHFFDWSTTDPSDDVWIADVNHLCKFALVEREITVARCERFAGKPVVSWNSRTGLIYSVQFATSLAEPEWVFAPGGINLNGTGKTLFYTNTTAAPQMFFRVVAH